jgi:hypothetical protein
MDLEALKEILIQLAGDAGFERGRSYPIDITAAEVKRILGDEPPPGAMVGIKVEVRQEAEGRHLAVVRHLQSLSGGKDTPREK